MRLCLRAAASPSSLYLYTHLVGCTLQLSLSRPALTAGRLYFLLSLPQFSTYHLAKTPRISFQNQAPSEVPNSLVLPCCSSLVCFRARSLCSFTFASYAFSSYARRRQTPVAQRRWFRPWSNDDAGYCLFPPSIGR